MHSYREANTFALSLYYAMTEQERQLNDFTTLFNMLRMQMQRMRADNARMHDELKRLEDKVSQLNEQLNIKQSEYDMLKMAKMVEFTDTDLAHARTKVAKLIREVNKCINLLSDK